MNVFGWKPNPQHAAQLASRLTYDSYGFMEVAKGLVAPDDKDVFLWRPLARLRGESRLHSRDQGSVGSCVGNACATCCSILEAVEISLHREPQRYVADAAADAMYALARDVSGDLGRGDGTSGSAAADAVTKVGVIYEIDYDDIDLRNYSPDRCRQWASRGVPASLKAAAAAHKLSDVTIVDSAESARNALLRGHPINVCSGQGFSGERDADGFMRPQGSWSHAMAILGYRATGRPGLLIANSWGDGFGSGPIWPDDMPHGAFWVDLEVADEMLRARDSYAHAGAAGWWLAPPDWSLILSA